MPPILALFPVDSPLWHNITSLQLVCRFEGCWTLQDEDRKLREVHRELLTICEVGGCNSGRVMDYIRAVNLPLMAS